MTHDHEVRVHLTYLANQILDRIVGGKVFALLDLATRSKGSRDYLGGLPRPEFPAMAYGDRAQTGLRQEGSYFFYLLGAFPSERPGGVCLFRGGFPMLNQVESHLFPLISGWVFIFPYVPQLIRTEALPHIAIDVHSIKHLPLL